MQRRLQHIAILLFLLPAIIFAGSGISVMYCCQTFCFCRQTAVRSEQNCKSLSCNTLDNSNREKHACCKNRPPKNDAAPTKTCQHEQVETLTLPTTSLPDTPAQTGEIVITDVLFSNYDSYDILLTSRTPSRNEIPISPPPREYLRTISILLI